jgi:hypothetical protein
MLGYCLALAQMNTGIRLHLVSMNINHYHLAATDPDAEVPEFSYVFHKYAAKCLNAYYSRRENLWMANQKTNYTELGDDASILEKAVYAITNVVKDGLVSRSELWEGLLLWRPGSYTFHRPDFFFDREGVMPETVHVHISSLPISGRETSRAVAEELGRAVKDKERELRDAARAEGRRFSGVKALRKVHHLGRPKRRLPVGELIPRVACKNVELRKQLLAGLKGFAEDYAEARERWIAGDPGVVFPAGTYKLRREFKVCCDRASGNGPPAVVH